MSFDPERVIRFRGGIHPADGKPLTNQKPLRIVPLLPQYTVPLRQNLGKPPVLCVRKGDHVKKGTLIANADGFVSVPLHSPCCGTVGDIVELFSAAGTSERALVIHSDGTDEWDTSLAPITDWENADSEQLKKRIQDCGIVGMGGASFPTHVKLSPPPEKVIDTLIVNAAECEPFLTADHRLLLDFAEDVLTGAAIAGKILQVARIIIGIEENKPDALEKIRKISMAYRIRCEALSVRYPQGAEKQLIYALTGRQVVEGGLPMDAGCVVANAGTCAAIANAVLKGHPLIERIVTVTGTPLADPCNWLVRIGTPASELIQLCGGIRETPAKLLFGGPMMGIAQRDMTTPVAKNTSGILLLSQKEVRQFEGNPCIRCGRCVKVCPMNLLVPTISMMSEAEKYDGAARWYVMNCIECGACAYVCPAHRPLVQLMRLAKKEIAAKRRKKQE